MAEVKKNLKVSISGGNIKLGEIPSISFPPIVTCCNCSECARKCYALKMCHLRKRVAAAWQNNLEIWQTNPAAIEAAILNAAIPSAFFRYFVGGDIPDPDFFKLMIKIAKKVKTCSFLCFTKKYELINNFLDLGWRIPKNLKIIFSEWDRPVDNPHELPCSAVIFKGQETPPGAMVCGGNCCNCIARGIGCWKLKKGEKIFFHEH